MLDTSNFKKNFAQGLRKMNDTEFTEFLEQSGYAWKQKPGAHAAADGASAQADAIVFVSGSSYKMVSGCALSARRPRKNAPRFSELAKTAGTQPEADQKTNRVRQRKQLLKNDI